jgi:hypothetical protein
MTFSGFPEKMVSPLKLYVHRHIGHGLEITTEDKHNVVYSVTRSRLSQQMTITSPAKGESPETVIGTAHFSYWAPDFTVAWGEQRISIQKSGMLTSSYDVIGPGIDWRWERDGIATRNQRLVDEKGAKLAEYSIAALSIQKMGVLTVVAVPPHTLDLIVLTCMAKIENEKRRSRNGTMATGIF